MPVTHRGLLLIVPGFSFAGTCAQSYTCAQFFDRNPEAPIPYIQWYKVYTRLSTAFDTFMSNYYVLLICSLR